MSTCNTCSLEATINIENPYDSVIEVDYPCCEEYLFSIEDKQNSQFVIDSYCSWEDENKWDDSAIFSTDCTIDIYITCIPDREDVYGYRTKDGMYYATNNGIFYEVCSS